MEPVLGNAGSDIYNTISPSYKDTSPNTYQLCINGYAPRKYNPPRRGKGGYIKSPIAETDTVDTVDTANTANTASHRPRLK